MITGRETLASIDEALNQAHERIAAVEGDIAGFTQRLAAMRQSQTEDYRELAKVRLDRVNDPALNQYIDQAEQQVINLYKERDVAFGRLQDQILQAEAEREHFEEDRAAKAAELDVAVVRVDEAEAKTQTRLDADTDYRAQREKAEEAERKAMHADEKATRSEEEREQKGVAYREDPLFMYLWDRKYGLPDYQAGGLFRYLDAKVAKLVGFADARANYARLNEIPTRLREHANGLRAHANDAFTALRALDEAAKAEDGIPSLEEEVKVAQQEVDELDRLIADQEKSYQALLQEKADYATGEDTYAQRALEFLANEFQRDDLLELRRDAMTTPYPEDDIIVSRMVQREDEQHQIESSVASLKETITQHQQRLRELESLRSDFKRSYFDRAGSVFADDSMVAMVLRQFLEGMLDRRTLWKVLQEQQRYHPRYSDPTFGSGGFGRGTVWNGGFGDIGDIIGSLGRGGLGGGPGRPPFGGGRRGGGGGGGFRTGGGF